MAPAGIHVRNYVRDPSSGVRRELLWKLVAKLVCGAVGGFTRVTNANSKGVP